MNNLTQNFGYLYDLDAGTPKGWYEIGIYAHHGICLWTYIYYESKK